MGAGASTGLSADVKNPFPISPEQSTNLDKLSMVAARILSTPDLYDFSNLAKPGVCGDYAVFLKKDLTKKLLPFVTQVSTKEGAPPERVEVVYQSSRGSLPDRKAREKVCGEMVDTMLRVCMTVVACLASMQIATTSREAATAGIGAGATTDGVVQKQVGGAAANMEEIISWLYTNRYLAKRPASVENTVGFLPGSGGNISFDIAFSGTIANALHGRVTAGADGFPPGSFTILFLNPIQLPGGTSMLPVSVKDVGASKIYLVGVLIGQEYKSLGRAPPTTLALAIGSLYNKIINGTALIQHETSAEIEVANRYFGMLRGTTTPQESISILGNTIGPYLQQSGFSLQQQVPGYPPAYPGGYPGGAAQIPYGAIAPVAQPYPFGARPYQQQLYGPRAPMLSAGPSVGQFYHIPPAAAQTIGKVLTDFRKLLPKQSSPAAVRALTLRGMIDPATRTILTGYCRDPYWTQSTLRDIFPWSTFQFLSIKNWGTLTAERRNVQFESEWTEFLSGLQERYNGADAPLLERPSGAMFLDQMRVKGLEKIRLCNTADGNPRVRFEGVTRGVQELQQLYAAHIKQMWGILNSLITVLVDPATRAETVRLHPAVLAGESSKTYVDGKAREAREALKNFYLAVESKYLQTIRSLEPVI
jgi:hypothetical protein